MFNIKKMMPDLYIGIKIRKKQSNKVLSEYKEKGHSWTRNAYNFLFTCMFFNNGTTNEDFGPGHISSKRYDGNLYGNGSYTCLGGYTLLGAGYYNTYSNGALTGGIFVGSGDASFSPDDYNLDSFIEHGSGSGQLLAGAMSSPDTDYTNKIWTNKISRDFTNDSGNDVTVKEVGLFNYCRMFGSYPYHFLFARDVLEMPVVVGDSEILTINYEISKDFSGID